ncbi:uncharacterized protein A4U43_C02F22130 [Asparagus officinalis]|uniref:F-box associated domain-containing protein n=1 Tax=Asparagus officinalis TaxID=4686 RepID=A0A5P1FQ22_ASPOF|nr:uncharacterized protein A4U43_C02F22130 [Asparagus officinalis]
MRVEVAPSLQLSLGLGFGFGEGFWMGRARVRVWGGGWALEEAATVKAMEAATAEGWGSSELVSGFEVSAMGPPPFLVHDESLAIVDEAVHFLPDIFTWRLAVDDLHDDDNETIARFDLKRDEWSELPLPGDSRDGACFFRLTQLGGSLCMQCSGPSRVDLWLLEEGLNSCVSWVKAYSIDRCCYPHQFCVVHAEKDGRALLERCDGKLQVYNPVEERVEATIFSGEGSFFGVSFYVESFMALDDESFESLKKQEAI